MFPPVRADFDVDSDRRGRPWDSVIRVLWIIGEAAIVVAALAILYLAFRGPSGHRPPSAAPPAASPSSAQTAAGRVTDQGASQRPTAVPPTSAPPAAPSPSPSPSASPSQATGPLAAQAGPYLEGRQGKTEVAVYDLATGRQWTLGPRVPQAEESAVKLEVLEAVLHQRHVRRTVMSLSEQELTPPMIEQNDSAAITAMWRDAGDAKGMRAFDHAARLTHTSPSNCLQCPGASVPGWAKTTTTPQDQITLLRQLARPSGVLDSNDRKYALRLLENVAPAQRWGIAGGVPAGVTVALDNGLLRVAGKSDWQLNSAGWVTGDGRNYLIAVLSTHDPSERYGLDTLNHLGAKVWTALAPRRG